MTYGNTFQVLINVPINSIKKIVITVYKTNLEKNLNL